MATKARYLAALAAALALTARSAAAQTPAPPTPACGLLSVAEVRQLTGRSDYPDWVDGDAEGEGAGGGSSCQYGGATGRPGGDPPLLSVVLITGKNWTEASRGFPLREGCRREPVAQVGDDAFFEFCPDSRTRRSSPLYVKAGTSDLIVQIDVEPPATEASVRPVVLAVARAAVRTLR